MRHHIAHRTLCLVAFKSPLPADTSRFTPHTRPPRASNIPIIKCKGGGHSHPTAISHPVLHSQHAPAPPTGMRASPSFTNGTTQGARWYTALGTLQDWVWWQLGHPHLTLELHTTKTYTDPSFTSADRARVLPTYWAANRSSIVRLLETAHMGLRLRVLDPRPSNSNSSSNSSLSSSSGTPRLLAARVEVEKPARWPARGAGPDPFSSDVNAGSGPSNSSGRIYTTAPETGQVCTWMFMHAIVSPSIV